MGLSVEFWCFPMGSSFPRFGGHSGLSESRSQSSGWHALAGSLAISRLLPPPRAQTTFSARTDPSRVRPPGPLGHTLLGQVLAVRSVVDLPYRGFETDFPRRQRTPSSTRESTGTSTEPVRRASSRSRSSTFFEVTCVTSRTGDATRYTNRRGFQKRKLTQTSR